jgi:hypothetical protein
MSQNFPASMHWQIYQAYRSGPHALFELFEQAFGRNALCGIHLLWELTYFEELSAKMKVWAMPLKEVLLEMRAQVERVSGHGVEAAY